MAAKRLLAAEPAARHRWLPRLPVLDWARGYDRETFVGDLLAALIVTIMLIPQSLAYALLAGLPPEVGLYASVAPLLLYAIFGSSRTLAVGPVAVISGFISASGLLIAASQLKTLMGVRANGHRLVDLDLGILRRTWAYSKADFAAVAATLLARQQLEAIAEPLRRTGFAVSTRAIMGDVAERILALTTEIGADALVVGTHGRKGLSHLLLGSVTEKVVRGAPVPVVCVRTPTREATPTPEESDLEDELAG